MLGIIAIILLVLFALGVPIAIAMGLSGFAALLIRGDIPLETAAQRFVTGVDSFPLLAVPFFILAGALMNTGGITERLVRLAVALVGRITGGLGHVVVVTNMIMAGMSGSAVADAAGTGSVLIPAMVRAGFGKGFSAAVTAAASTIGPIIPPSIPFVVASLLAWILTFEQAGPALVRSVTGLTRDPYLVLLIINILLLILGCFLETLSLMIILVPVLMPLIRALGIDPVHFGVVFTLN